jgi:hypothetical protein
MLRPKSSDANGENDAETGTKSSNKSNRISCRSCGQLTSPNKANRKTKAPENERSDEESTADADMELGDIKAKSVEPLVDTEAIKSIVEQSKSLYTALEPSSDPHDISYDRESEIRSVGANGDMNAAQTGYDDVDMSLRQYDYFDMQAFG